VARLLSTALWGVSPDLLLALDEQLGAPVDSYVNGSQTWLAPAEPGADEPVLEWRLHPVVSYRAPAGISHYEIWETVVAELAAGSDPEVLTLGDERRTLTSLWDGLEVYAAYGAELEPATLARAASERLGMAPERVGLVDHDTIADAWERARGEVSIVALLRQQLTS
jgi:hypothetical protein